MSYLRKINSLFVLYTFFITIIFVSLGLAQDEQHVKIKSYLSVDKVPAGSEVKIAVEIKVDEGWHINSNSPHEDFLIPSEIRIDTSSGFSLVKISYPLGQDIKLGFSDQPISVYENYTIIIITVKIPETIAINEYKTIIYFDYQACNNMTCSAPNTAVDTLSIPVVEKDFKPNVINQEIFKKAEFGTAGEIKKEENNSDDSFSSMMEKSGLLLGLLIVFIGGLALNLTPCVYPLIPITIGYFGGQSQGNTKKLVMMGLLYVVGIAITYSAVGVVTALTGSVFGSLLQNTYVILFIVLIFLVLSLSMFGVYEFKLPDSLVAKAGGARSGLFGAFFMGLTMGIVAAPCIGPFVLGLVTFVAAKADPYLGFLMFFVLALGLGFPYFLLAIFSGKIKSLPRAGIWMEGVKHIFGLLLIGMAIYFALPLIPKSISGYLLPVFMIISAIYLLFIDKLANNLKGFRIFKIVFAVLLLVVAVYSLIPSEKKSPDWKPFTEEAYNEAIKSSQPILIDFYADWCIPCKELDGMTFPDPKVIEESKRFNCYKADMTKSISSEVEQLRNKFNIVGVPTVIIINSKGEEVKRITGFVKAEEFLKYLQSAK